MKKLFLTSGIIACMACPAFADPVSYAFTAAQGEAAYDNNGTGAISGACVEPTIGTYDTSTTMVANWDVNYAVMLLNENDGDYTANGGATPLTYDTTTPGNEHLWLTPYNSETHVGGGVYKRTGTTDANFAFQKQNVGASVITAPTGIDVNYINNVYSLPSSATTVATSTLQNGSSTGNNRGFLGYYANGTTNATINNTTGGNQMITSAGLLTQEGYNAAASYDNDTPWVALYNLVRPTVTDPSAYGYHFTGWKINNEGDTIATANLQPIGENKSLYAQWAADQYKLTYSCANAEGTLGTGTPSANPASNIPVTFDMTTFTWASNTDSGDAPNCHQNGYHFTGWSCTATSSDGGTVLSAFSLTSSGNMSCSDSTQATDGVHDNPGTCTGSTLANFNPTGLQNGANITCNAVYAKNVVAISWTDPAGGNQPTDNTCTYTESVTVPTNPERPGYVFTGWTVQQ